MRIDRYPWSGGEEAMLRFGPDSGPVVVMALPLFEEANRVRAFAVSILRALAVKGIAGALPDLPGQGESLVRTQAVTFPNVEDGLAAAVDHLHGQGHAPYAAGVRSGALLDAAADVRGRWYLAPQSGSELLRELTRVRQAQLNDVGQGGTFRPEPDSVADAAVEIAGNMVSPDFLADLAHREPFTIAPLRVVRLESDARPADRKVNAPPLWRHAEPGSDPVSAQTLADDIADWVRTCEGC